MSRIPNVGFDPASAPVAIEQGTFCTINNALNYAANLVVCQGTLPDITEQTLRRISLPGKTTGCFDGLSDSLSAKLTALQTADGEASLRLSLHGSDAEAQHTFESIPEGSMSTATTTFLQYRGHERKRLVHTRTSKDIARLLDQLLGSINPFMEHAQRYAYLPFSDFVQATMTSARRFLHGSSLIQKTYRAELIEMHDGELHQAMQELANKRGVNASEVDAFLQDTEATLQIVHEDRRQPVIHNTLAAPVTVRNPAGLLGGNSNSDFMTLRSIFDVWTPLNRPNQWRRALKNPIINAEIRVENTGTTVDSSLNLHRHAQRLAADIEPAALVCRSLKILSDSKNLGLADLN